MTKIKSTSAPLDVMFCDVDGVGRYLIRRRAKNSRQFILLLNGEELGLFSDARDAIAAATEHIHRDTQ